MMHSDWSRRLCGGVLTFASLLLVSCDGRSIPLPLGVSTNFLCRKPSFAYFFEDREFGGKQLNITVLPSSRPLLISVSNTEVQLDTNFEVSTQPSVLYTLELFLIDTHGAVVARVTNSLNNSHTVLPTTEWMGPVTLLSTMKLPPLGDGVYAVDVALRSASGQLQLTPGPGTVQDNRCRYEIGRIRIDSSASTPAPLLPPPTLNLTGYRLTLDESFSSLSISDSVTYDGARWYARNEECCMSTTDGSATAMVGIRSPDNPFSRLPGSGLNIRLQRAKNAWTSGVITSVDDVGRGFSQKYGYFEMKARFPSGEDTWPAFWLLNTAAKSHGASAGEIDIVEYIANSGFRSYIATTLHDWSTTATPAASHHRVASPTDGFHTYGMMWSPSTMTFYFDGSVTMRCPTPLMMKQPYYLLVDLGLGGGWPTEKTPAINDLNIQYIRAYTNTD